MRYQRPGFIPKRANRQAYIAIIDRYVGGGAGNRWGILQFTKCVPKSPVPTLGYHPMLHGPSDVGEKRGAKGHTVISIASPSSPPLTLTQNSSGGMRRSTRGAATGVVEVKQLVIR